MEIRIPKEHFKWIFLQRSALELKYKLDWKTATEDEVSAAVTEDFLADFKTIEESLPIDGGLDILDIGGGIGIMGILISRHFGGDVNIHIVDKDDFKLNHNQRMIDYGSIDTMGAYNNFAATIEVMALNGVDMDRVFLYDTNKGEFPVNGMNAVISITSCGWHYPISA